MFTRDDYFDHGFGQSVADLRAQDDIDEIIKRFERVLKWQGCEQSRYSDWYYSVQCHGLVAEPTGYNSWWNLRPMPVLPSDVEWWCDYDLMRVWQRHYYRLKWLADTMERYEDEGEDFDWYDIDDDAFNAIYTFYDRLRTHVMDEYEEAFEEAIRDLCHTVEKLLLDVCDYAYSDEAADEWVKFQNEEEAWMEEQEAIRRFENMVGQTASYEGWAA